MVALVLGWSGRVPGRLVSHILSFVSQFFSFVSQAGCLWCLPLSFVSHFFSCVSHFLSFVSQARCLWSGSRLACLPFPFICFPLLFICPGWLVSHFLDLSPISFQLSPSSFHLSPHWMLVVGFRAGLSPTSLHLSPTFSPNSLLLGVLNSFLRCCPPFVSLLVSAHFHWPLVV